MKKHRNIHFVLLTVLVALFVFAGVTYADAPVEILETTEEPTKKTVNQAAPITILADSTEEYGCRVRTDLSVYKRRERKYYVFLPSTAEPTEVLVRYDGTKKLYLPEDGTLHSPGSTLKIDFSAAQTSIFEYDEENHSLLEYSLTVMAGENNPAVYITLDRGEAGLLNINSSHHAVETGHIAMVDADGKTIYDGGLTRMKGHGLTSYQATHELNTKNSYNINLEKKAELIENAGKSKKWSMLRIRTHGNYDATGVSYPLGFYTYDALVGEDYFNITARYVDVYINGEYRGVYILTERMDINGSMQVTDLEEKTTYSSDDIGRGQKNNKNDPAMAAGIDSYTYCRTASVPEGTDITGGYVLEIMCGTYGEYGFRTNKGMFINVKSPSHPSKEQVRYIAEYVQNFENALFSETGYNDLGKHYTEYIDMKSFGAQALTYSFYLNWENYRTSTYIHKDADGQEHDLLTFGPVWDFETGPSLMTSDKTLFGTSYAYTERQQYIWYQEFWQKADFMKYLTSMVGGMRTIHDQLLGKTEGNRIFNLGEMLDSIAASQEMNWIRWNQEDEFEQKASAMEEGVEKRYDRWYNTIWNPENYLLGATVTTAIESSDGTYTLTVETVGTADGYQWYRLNDDLVSGTAIEGATSQTYTVTDDGAYYCGITGKNNAQWSGAAGKVFRKKNIEMFTDPVRPSAPDSLAILTLDEYILPEEPEIVVEEPVEDVPDKPETDAIPEETDVPASEPATPTVPAIHYGVVLMTVIFAAVAIAAITLLAKKSNKHTKTH